MRRKRFVMVMVGMALVGAVCWFSIPARRLEAWMRHGAERLDTSRAQQVDAKSGLAKARRDATRLVTADWGTSANQTEEESQCSMDMRDAAATLIARQPAPTSVEDALGRALLGTLLEDHHKTTRAFASVARRWPADARAAWLAWEYCQKDKDCDRAPFLQHLLAVDADNVLAWLASLDDAVERRDEGAIAIYLRHAGMASGYQSPGKLVYFLARPLLAQLEAPGSCHGLDEDSLRIMLGREPVPADVGNTMAHGMAIAISFDVGVRINHVCDIRANGLSESRRRDCINALGWLARDGSSFAQDVATRLLIRILDPRDSAPWREHYRQLRWLQQIGPPPVMPPEGFDRIWAGGEVQTQVAWARDAGLWPPPPNWLPSAQEARRLILEGR